MSKNISVSPAELRSRAKKFISGGQQIESIMKSLNKEADALPNIWKGQSQAQFSAKYNELKPRLKEFSDLVDSIGKQLQSVADVMERADDDIARQIGR